MTGPHLTDDCAVSFEPDCDEGVVSLLVEWEGGTLRLVGSAGQVDSLTANLRAALAEAVQHEDARQGIRS